MPQPAGSFMIIDFPDPMDNSIVYVETPDFYPVHRR